MVAPPRCGWPSRQATTEYSTTVPPKAILKNPRNIPINIFGNNIPRMTETRRRYELLFGLLLNSGLRVSEALGLKVADVRLVDGTARSVRVIGKGNKERLDGVPNVDMDINKIFTIH